MKNKVYVVQYSDYDTHQLVGVFSTKDKAEEAKNKYEKRMSENVEKQIKEMDEANAGIEQSDISIRMREYAHNSMRKKCFCNPVDEMTIDEMLYSFNYEHLRFDAEQL